MSSTPNFRVIIVGGGVSGLTLGKALEKSNVEYLLLESRDEVAPHVGASIAIATNGARVLDQLGCWDPIAEASIPMDDIVCYNSVDGREINRLDGLVLNTQRTGYPFVFTHRQLLLQTLYDSVQDKSKILKGKRVSHIDHFEDRVSVQCEDGSTYTGAVVVGGDGVHSVVRHEMWRHMSISDPSKLPNVEATLMTSSYKCMYGISKAVKGMKHNPGEKGTPFNQVIGKDISFLHTVDKSGLVFWFVFQKHDKVYQYPDVPKYTQKDAEALGESCCSFKMTDQHIFKDLWDQRLSCTLVAVEEAWFNHWTFGRIACMGDSIHKWTPNIGMGGNNAIESAAALANELYKLSITKSGLPSIQDVETGLHAYHEHRKARARRTHDVANLVTRLEAQKGPIESFFVFNIAPYLGDWLANTTVQSYIAAEKLDHLPDPERSLQGTVAYNQNYGVGHEPSLFKRAVRALPFLLHAYIVHKVFQGILAQPAFQAETGKQIARNAQLLGTGKLPEIFQFLLGVFSPGLFSMDRAHQLQCLTFLVNLGPLFALWVLEAHRRGNVVKLASFPVVFGMMAQLLGIGVAGPLFFFLHYIQNPIDDYIVPDWRMVKIAKARTLLPAIVLAFTTPTFAMYLYPGLNTRLPLNATWQPFPIWVHLVHHIFSRYLVTDTTKHDRIWNPKADLPYIRLTVRVLALIGALTFNAARLASPVSLYHLYKPDFSLTWSMLTSSPKDVGLVAGMKTFFQLDELSVVLAACVWLGLLLRDLREAEMTDLSWAKAMGVVAAGLITVGPGATISLAWLWREEVLATKKAKGAVVRGSGGSARPAVVKA